jgi:S1-C subfamily serine protease
VTKNNLIVISIILCTGIFGSKLLYAQTLPQVVQKVKPSIMGIGTLQSTRRPRSKLLGTGFVVADGYHVITNYHVIPQNIDTEKKEQLVIFFRQNKRINYRKVRVLDQDKEHDLALLRMEGRKFPALKIVQQGQPQEEGDRVAFTGFPMGAVLGLFPVTHQGIISSISPVVIPAPSSSTLSVKMIKRLKHPYMVYQLDATAYPGNSGSPLFNVTNGKVLGVINKVFIKESKESILQKPSGITYAIPSDYILKLLKKNKIAYK